VVSDDETVLGRIFKAVHAPAGKPWAWTIVSNNDPTHGYGVTREAVCGHSRRLGTERPDQGTALPQPELPSIRSGLEKVARWPNRTREPPLGRATSVISYSITNLEAQLGVLLFDREATRKPQLTEAGRAVLSEAAPSPTASVGSAPKSEAFCRASRQKSTSSLTCYCPPRA